MLGLMQDWPLLCHRIIDHAAVNHGAATDRDALDRRSDCTARITPRCAGGRSSGTRLDRDGISSVIASRRLPGTHGAIWKPGTASWGLAPSTTRSIRAFFRADRLDRQSRARPSAAA